jgi:hypothetical protein
LLDQLNNIITRAMAMRQKDRYPTIAEFSNDLRKVLAALPAPQSTTPPRPLDPNSTQPDLPLIYEAVQRAKENASQAQPGVANKPPDLPAAQPAQTPLCPRCSAPLTQQSSFCPRCGSSLSNTFKASAATTVVEPDAKIKKTPPHDTTLDKTMVITPDAQAKVLTYQSISQKPALAPSVRPSPVGKISQPGVQAQNNSANKNAAQSPVTPAAPSPPTINPPAQAPGSNIPLRIIIAAALVILLVVIAVVFLFLISHGQSSHTLQNNDLWFSLGSS